MSEVRRPLRTRRDFREAGRALGQQLAEQFLASSRQWNEQRPPDEADTLCDALAHYHVATIDEAVRVCLAAGNPRPWALAFRRACFMTHSRHLRREAERLRAASLPPPATH